MAFATVLETMVRRGAVASPPCQVMMPAWRFEPYLALCFGHVCVCVCVCMCVCVCVSVCGTDAFPEAQGHFGHAACLKQPPGLHETSSQGS